jgi:hypothetical protein
MRLLGVNELRSRPLFTLTIELHPIEELGHLWEIAECFQYLEAALKENAFRGVSCQLQAPIYC